MNFASTALCAAALSTLIVSAAQATELVTPRFTVHSEQTYTVVSDADGITTLSVPFSGRASAGPERDSYSIGLDDEGTVTLASGYKVTGIGFSATVVGVRKLFGDYGEVSNRFLWAFDACASRTRGCPDVELDPSLFWLTVGSVNGSQKVSAFAPVDFDKTFLFGYSSWLDAAVYPQEDRAGGYASIYLVNPVMTIFTSPVPEPQAWALLLTGLPVLGALARRRRSAKAA